MFYCYVHNWSSIDAACPICFKPIYTATNDCTIPVHKEPEQQNPKEFWVTAYGDRYSSCDIHGLPTHEENEFKVTEVPKGYKLISRDEFTKAWESCPQNEVTFLWVLKELGFSND